MLKFTSAISAGVLSHYLYATLTRRTISATVIDKNMDTNKLFPKLFINISEKTDDNKLSVKKSFWYNSFNNYELWSHVKKNENYTFVIYGCTCEQLGIYPNIVAIIYDHRDMHDEPLFL
jgi:hypothetical protein